MAGRRLLAAAGLAGLAVLAPAVPVAASSVIAPRIGSFSPAHGPAGTKATIAGSGFTGVKVVRFGGVAAVFKVLSGSEITAAVPTMPSAVSHITVTTGAGTARSRARFTVTPAVRFSPAAGPPGSVVAVSGTGFAPVEGADIFVGTTDEALAGTGPAGSFGPITVTIPAAAAPGTAWISAEGRRSRLSAQAAFTVNTSWAQFRYSATRTGTNPLENVLSATGAARLGLDWSFRTGNRVLSSPAVVGGVVYIGSHDHNLYALNAATGARRWRFRDTFGLVSSPAVAGGVVYVGSFGGNVYALNAATGTMRWTFRSGAIFTTGGAVYSSPAVAGGVVYAGTFDGKVWALNAATGARLWTFTTGDAIFSSPTVAGGAVYIRSLDRNVYAISAATGLNLWTFATADAVYSSPAVADRVVYIGSDDGNVYALNATTGAKLWSSATGGIVFSSPAVADGVVYIGSESGAFDGSVYAIDAATGTRLWTYPTGGQVDSSPAVANGMVYIGGEDGNVYASGPASGRATASRPHRNSLHPDHNLPQQR